MIYTVFSLVSCLLPFIWAFRLDIIFITKSQRNINCFIKNKTQNQHWTCGGVFTLQKQPWNKAHPGEGWADGDKCIQIFVQLKTPQPLKAGVWRPQSFQPFSTAILHLFLTYLKVGNTTWAEALSCIINTFRHFFYLVIDGKRYNKNIIIG